LRPKGGQVKRIQIVSGLRTYRILLRVACILGCRQRMTRKSRLNRGGVGDQD
jgi:hypothetical protein